MLLIDAAQECVSKCLHCQRACAHLAGALGSNDMLCCSCQLLRKGHIRAPGCMRAWMGECKPAERVVAPRKCSVCPAAVKWVAGSSLWLTSDKSPLHA